MKNVLLSIVSALTILPTNADSQCQCGPQPFHYQHHNLAVQEEVEIFYWLVFDAEPLENDGEYLPEHRGCLITHDFVVMGTEAAEKLTAYPDPYADILYVLTLKQWMTFEDFEAQMRKTGCKLTSVKANS